MAQNSLPSWSLVAFATSFGRMMVGSFTNEDGIPFKSCIFVKGIEKTFVGFSQKLGELTPEQISEQKDKLQVVRLDSGKYKLCRVGENNWKDVDLGI